MQTEIVNPKIAQMMMTYKKPKKHQPEATIEFMHQISNNGSIIIKNNFKRKAENT
jgi:hypothetical protein